MKIYKLACICLAAGIALTAETVLTPVQLVAHEWGTFTSVADLNGNPVNWFALGGPSVLPCFVHRGGIPKVNMMATVRMETPVIYFYATRKTPITVNVAFRNGRMTEWYPKATQTADALAWNIEALPGEKLVFPTGSEPNDYYASRATDSAPLRAGTEQEKLLFYRGVGDMEVPVRPRYTSAGRIELRKAGAAAVPAVIVFENRSGKTGFRAVGELNENVEVDAPVLSADTAGVQRELETALVAAGLYPKEAAAMLATWRTTWFEEGTRVFYIAPSAMVEASLPMKIAPKPAALQRVFVGRIEVLAPATQKDLKTGVTAKYTRFLSPFWEEMKRAGMVTSNMPGLPFNNDCAK